MESLTHKLGNSFSFSIKLSHCTVNYNFHVVLFLYSHDASKCVAFGLDYALY